MNESTDPIKERDEAGGHSASPQTWSDEALERRYLECDWTLDDLRFAVELLRRTERSSSLYQAIENHDAVRDEVAALGAEIDIKTASGPDGGMAALSHRLMGQRRATSGRRPSRLWGGRRWPSSALAGVALLGVVVGTAAWWSAFYEPAARQGSGSAVKTPSDTGQKPTSDSAGDNNERPRRTGRAALAVTGDELRHYSQAFHQVTATVDGRAGWMELSNDVGDVGIAREPLNKPNQLMLLRLTVHRDGERVAHSDLVSRPGQTADFTTVLRDNGHRGSASRRPLRVQYAITLGQSPADPVSIGMALRPRPGSKPTLASLSMTQSLPAGEPVRVGELTTKAGRLRLTVMLKPIDRSVASPDSAL